MRYTRIGASGLEVSRIGLGCMSFGVPERGDHSWTLTEEASRPLIRRAVELGVTLFDTANTYSDGTSEEIVGRALWDYARRDEIVVATKVALRMRPGPHGAGLSRKSIVQEVEHSLRRLGTDRIDLYQIHRLDPHTPIDEILQALDDLVRSGKVLYLGASSMHAWEFSKALHLQRHGGLARFVSMQSQYSLIAREDEREMFPLCLDEGVGALPWSPIGRGKLARPWQEATGRSRTDRISNTFYTQAVESDRRTVDAVGAVAEARDVPRAQVALAWVLAQEVVAAPLVGVTRSGHLDDAVAALDIKLTQEEIETLQQHYTPRCPEMY
ncbi:L-fuco-beta-pyranose dehydrogenase [Actinomycetales bacterium JB111]|nr:L-fuco-beta-pyranose dehydrogenase [Actinomycetales bacterium JB111]